MKSGLLAIVAAPLLAASFAIFSAQTIELYFKGDDLGRHLKNGELLLSSSAPAGTVSKLLHTNFYSYAVPDFEFVNHHWLTGVIYFLVWKRVGFAGLNAFYIRLGNLHAAFLRSLPLVLAEPLQRLTELAQSAGVARYRGLMGEPAHRFHIWSGIHWRFYARRVAHAPAKGASNFRSQSLGN